MQMQIECSTETASIRSGIRCATSDEIFPGIRPPGEFHIVEQETQHLQSTILQSNSPPANLFFNPTPESSSELDTIYLEPHRDLSVADSANRQTCLDGLARHRPPQHP
jgi:hypothetical protein